MSLKILLADDSLTAQNMGKKILTDAGYEVIAVSNGAQAMKRIVSDKPDLVLLDVYMPGYSGVEVCERMRNSRETAATPVLLSVGKMEAFQPEEGTRARADGLIVKPFEATELVEVVKKLTENVSPAPRSKRRPQPESMVEPAVEPVAEELEFAAQPKSFDIPQEIASTPVVGMDLIAGEAEESAPAREAAAPIEFEVERDPAPVELETAPGMASAAGCSGVFEIEPSVPAAVETSAEPVPVEEFETFSAPAKGLAATQPAEPTPAETSPTTVAHDFTFAPPETTAPVVESFSARAAAEPPSETEFDLPPQQTKNGYPPQRSKTGLVGDPGFTADPSLQRFGQVQPQTEVETPGPVGPLPELTSWDDPAPTFAAEMARPSADRAPDNSLAELSTVQFAPAVPVWVAEEAEIEPHESAISLRQQMQEQAAAAKVLVPEAAASPAECAPVQSWEAPALQVEPSQRQAELSTSNPAEILPEFEPPVPADAVEPSEVGSANSAGPLPQITLPRMTEVPVEPARLAHIVEVVLERFKPDLIAAVTRELQKENR